MSGRFRQGRTSQPASAGQGWAVGRGISLFAEQVFEELAHLLGPLHHVLAVVQGPVVLVPHRLLQLLPSAGRLLFLPPTHFLPFEFLLPPHRLLRDCVRLREGLFLCLFAQQVLRESLVVRVGAAEVVVVLAVLAGPLHRLLVPSAHALPELGLCYGLLVLLAVVVVPRLLAALLIALLVALPLARLVGLRVRAGGFPPGLVVLFPECALGEDLVGLVDLLEEFFLALVGIRVVLFRQAFECSFYLLRTRLGTQVQGFVVVNLMVKLLHRESSQ